MDAVIVIRAKRLAQYVNPRDFVKEQKQACRVQMMLISVFHFVKLIPIVLGTLMSGKPIPVY